MLQHLSFSPYGLEIPPKNLIKKFIKVSNIWSPLPLTPPDLSPTAFVAANAIVIGKIEFAPRSSVWYGVIIRADLNVMTIGECTNIQDGAILHGDPDQPLVIKEFVTIGHRAVIHGREIGRGSLIGMGAIVLEGVTVGAGSIVGAGAVVTKAVPDGVVCAGVPAKVIRETTEAEREDLISHAEHYYQLALYHSQKV